MDSIQHLLGVGTVHHQAGRLEQAEQAYRSILLAHPDQPDAIHLLGLLNRQRGDLASAAALIRRAIALNARVPAYHNNLGATCLDQGDIPAAAAAFAAALRLNPRHAQASYNLAFCQQQQGAFANAIDSYRRALALAPSSAQCWNNLGHCYFATGHPQPALDSFAKAWALDRNLVESVSNAAAVYLAIGQAEQAERIYRQILREHPDFAEAHHNLGLTLADRERPLEAMTCFQTALRLKPDYAEAHYALGNVLCEVGDYVAAAGHYEQALTQQPSYAAPRLALVMTAAPSLAGSVAESDAIPSQFAAAVEDLKRWCRVDPGALAAAIGSAQPFALAYRPNDVTHQLTQYGTLICQEARIAGAALGSAPSIGGKARVRLGIVSGHVRRHPVWQVILKGMLATIDQTRFDLRLYNTTRYTDEQTVWAAGQVAHHRPQPLTALRWTEHIAEDAPDLLYFPEVGMDPIAGFIAAHRLAPLQLASWGHPITTGLPSIDLFLSGALLESDSAPAHYTEQLICLPGTGVLTTFDGVLAQSWRGPMRAGQTVRFALCQQAMKFDPAYDRLIARVVAEAGDAELWVVHSVKHAWTAQAISARLAQALAQEGLDPSRHLRLTPWMREAEFYGFLKSMDVILDCPAFSGYTTAWQAIHCGVPIVTLDGLFLRQRLAAGLLRQIGVVEGVASDTDDYLARAVTLAERSRTPEGRTALSRELLAAAPRTDGNRAAIAAMEQAFLS